MKSFRLISLAFSVVALGLLASCNPKEEVVEDKVEITSQTSITVPQQGDTYRVEFTSSTAWSAALSAGSEAFAAINPASGDSGENTITLQVRSNKEGDDREFSLTITAGKATAKVEFVQDAAPTATTEVESLKIDGEGGELELPFKLNVQCNITSDSDWITVGETKALRDVTYIVKVARNPSIEESREGTVTVTPQGLDPIDITVSQDPFVPVITLSTFEYAPKEGGSVEADFETNMDVDVIVEGVEGTTAEVAEGKIIVTFPANEAFAPRNALLSIIPEDYPDAAYAVYVTQLGLAEIKWSVTITDQVDLAANICPVAYNNGNVIVADGTKLNVYSAVDGSFVKSVTPTLEEGVTPASVASDDAGHIIIAGTYNSGLENAKVWCASSVDDTPAVLFSFTQDIYSAMGNFRVHGDVTKSAVVGATVSVSQYWAAWQITDGALDGSMVRAEHPAPQTTAWSPFYQVCEPIGDKISDGLLYSSYPGRANVWYGSDPAGNTWNVLFPTTNNGNQNSCSLDVVTVGSKKLLLYMENSFFSYASPTFYVVDITDIANPALIGSMGAPFYSGGETNGCYGGGGIVGNVTSSALEIYVCDGGKNTLALISVPTNIL